jgi:hypothetical protein
MSIEYTYEIISVDEAARCMEVVYTSEGRQTMHIGARLPFVGESLEAVIQMYAPVAYWLEQEAEVVVPDVGVGGVVVPTPNIELPQAPVQVQMRQARLALLDAGLLDNVDAAITGIADPTSRKAAHIEWEFSPTVKRDSALVAQLAPALGLSDTQLDALFTAATNL